MQNKTRFLAHAALIAAVYVLLTVLLAPFSFGAMQLRLAEALTLLPLLTPAAVPGLFIGCLLANLLGGSVWFDVLLGSLATLLAAILTRRLRARPLLAAMAPVLCNGLIVGPVVYLAYVLAPGSPIHWPTLFATMGGIALSEGLICYAVGLPMLAALKRLPMGSINFFEKS